MSWSRFVAIGDSLTEGVGDPLPGGRLRGWAARLADALAADDPSFEFVNLARRGLTTSRIRRRQLELALELQPDLASVLAGMNDVLGTFDPAAYERDLEYMIGTLSDAGATVLTSTFPDVTRFIPLPARAKAGIRDRLLTANDVVREVATRQKAVWIDAEDLPHELVRWNFSIDFLHPSARGHLLIATAFAAKLSEVGGVPIELPGLGRARPVGRENARHMRWLVTEVGLPSMSKTVLRLGTRLLPGRST